MILLYGQTYSSDQQSLTSDPLFIDDGFISEFVPKHCLNCVLFNPQLLKPLSFRRWK